MPAPHEWVMTCPYCFASPTAFQPIIAGGETRDRFGAVRRWHPAACPACGGVVIAELTEDGSTVIDVIPSAVVQWQVGHLPPSVQHNWDEAALVYRVKAYASAVVACGRTLEAAADARDVRGGSLQQRITRMLEAGLITAEFKRAVEYARLIRNVGAHAGQEVSEDSAAGTMRFTQQTLRLLFEVPGELEMLTEHPPELDQNGDPQPE